MNDNYSVFLNSNYSKLQFSFWLAFLLSVLWYWYFESPLWVIGQKNLGIKIHFPCADCKHGTILRGKEPFRITPTVTWWVCTIVSSVRLIWIAEVLWTLPTIQQWVGFEVKMFAGQKTQSKIYVNFGLR